MKNSPRFAWLAALLAVAAPLLFAQSRPAHGSPFADSVVSLKDNIPPFAQARFDQGPVADSFAAPRILLLLRRSPEKQAALDQFLEDAATPGNPQYHRWLTPAQFGAAYGPDDAAIAKVEDWLQQQGFMVARVTPGRTAIEFSGTAGQIRHAFRTAIHTYAVGGRLLHANNADPQIPASLAPLVLGLTPLTDVHPHSAAVVRREGSLSPADPHSGWSIGCGGADCTLPALLVAPGDFAVQYDLNPLYKAGLSGSGATIGVVGDSNIDPAMVKTYRSFFSLSPATINVVVDGNDPGENGDSLESELDVELSGSVAQNAAIDLYVSADTALQSGLALAAQRAVDEDAADIVSVSYEECEQYLGAGGNAFWSGLWEQAAAQGQTVLVASGDQGAATCDADDPVVYPNPAPLAEHGLTVNGLASTPWNVAVGGTDFYYSPSTADQVGTYWNLTTSSAPAVSLLQPVPEQPWNRAFGQDLAGTEPDTLVAAGGGASNCTAGTAASDGAIASCSGGYAKPTWQTGAGVPADGARDLPDLSLFAAAGENDSAYPICTELGPCATQPGLGFTLTEVGGTSASAQAMAGIMALVVQKYGRQGQAAWTLYPMAAQHPEAFHDVAAGNNKLSCTQGKPDCSESTSSDGTQGNYVLGYDAAAGFDLASGLGSIDATALVSKWGDVSFAPTTTTLALSHTTFAYGTPVTAQVTVTGSGGTPSGQVALITTAAPAVNTGAGTLTLAGGSASASFGNLPGGKYTVMARYGGDGTFAASESAPVTVDVTPGPSTVTLSVSAWPFTENGWGNGWLAVAAGGTYEYGDAVRIDAQVSGASGSTGMATGTVTFSSGSLSSGPVPVNSQGFAEWTPQNGFPAGTHGVTATYSGDGSLDASSSPAPFQFTVAKNTVWAGGDEGCSANDTFPYGTPACLEEGIHLIRLQGDFPTGTITFLYGKTNLGSSPIECCDPPPPYPQPYFWASNARMVTTSSLPLGTDTVTVAYSGDANYNPLSFPITIKITPGLTMTAAARPNVVAQNGSFTVTAALTGVAGEPVPTGSVSFSANNPAYAGQFATGAAAVANGAAAYTFSLTPADFSAAYPTSLITVDVYYAGDSIYGPANSSVNIGIGQAFAIQGQNVTELPDGPAQSTLTVTPMNGFSGSVGLQCALTSWPASASASASTLGCSITPATVSLSGSEAENTTMSITPGGSAAAQSGGWLLPGGAAFLAFAVFLGLPARRRPWRALLCLLAGSVVLAGIAACGSNQGHQRGIPAGNYVFTVTGITGSGPTAITEQSQVTVTVP